MIKIDISFRGANGGFFILKKQKNNRTFYPASYERGWSALKMYPGFKSVFRNPNRHFKHLLSDSESEKLFIP